MADSDSTVSPRRMILALWPGVMLAGIAGGMAFPILPSVGIRVGLPFWFIGLVLAMNRVVRVLLSPLVGSLIDRYGGRRTLLVGNILSVFSIALFILGVTTSFTGTFFLLGRMMNGMASSCIFVAAPALALTSGGKEHGGGVVGAVRSATAVGVPAGLVGGGFLSAAFGDAKTFEIATAATIAAAFCTYFLVPDLRVSVTRRATIFEAARELLDKRLAAIGALGFASTFAGSGMVLTTTTVMVHARNLSAFGLGERSTASVLMGWLVMSEASGMPIMGRIGDKKNAHAILATLGLAGTIPALIVLAYSERVMTIGIGLAMLGVAVAGLGPSLLALLGRIVPPDRRGLGVGALQVATDIGGALGPLVGSALFTTSLSIPYLATALVSLLLLPFGFVLIRSTRAVAT